MKKLFILIASFAFVCNSSFSQTFTGGGGSIPDWGDAYFDLNVTGLGGTDVLVSVCVNISHGNTADIEIFLVDPLGNEHELSSDNGGSGNNYTGTCFTNTAATNITAGSAPFTGNWIPECGTLPTGLYPNALWRLHIYDDALFDTGDLLNWSLTFESPACATVGFNGLPATLNCNDAAVTMYANDSATANGAIYPTIFFQYDTDDYGSAENRCRIWESSTSTLLYENLAMDDNTVLTVYATGPLMSPSETYTTEIYESYGDGGIDLVVYDGNGTVYDTYSYPAGSTGWLTRGPYVPAGISTWSASGLGITAVADWGAAVFNPAVAGPGVHTITYCWNNEAGCSDCASQDITVLNPWDASWTSPGTICASDGNISLTALITGNTGGTFSGTGVSAGNFNPTGLSGDYSVTYTVGSSTSCRDQVVQTITVIPIATASAGSDDVICGNNSYLLSGASIGGSSSSVLWTSSGTGTFDDNTIANSTYTPSAGDLSAGSITLTIQGSGACESAEDQIVLTFGEEFSFTEYDTICPGDSILWHGNYYSTASTFHANYTTIYGCDSSYHLQLFYFNAPVISSVNTGDIYDCQSPDGFITIQATSGSPAYQYSINNGTSFENSPSYTSLSSGTYQIIVIDQNGCTDTDIAVLNDISGTEIDSLIILNLNCYNDESGTIIIYSENAVNYSIDSATTFQSENIFSSLEAGIYNIVVENNYHCRAEMLNVEITQPDSLYLTLLVNSEIECYGETGSLSVEAEGGTLPYSILWSNSGTETTESFGPGTAGVTVTDNNSCVVSESYIFSNPPQIITSFSVTNETCSGVADGSIDYTANGGTGSLLYNWSTPLTTQDISGLSANTYLVTVTDENNCTKTDTIIVLSEGNPETCIVIPTAFTPNGDGVNDTWAIKNSSLIQELKIEIFNRWGQLIFSFEGSGLEYA
ncbi:MAG: gliding motility-associated C-terminal domain-containing protein, partial [Bacteroidales bacterium]|nr:gliding motility-associated C-terminal domain-containing protein [Bacteroidales bacterium]